MPCRTERSAGRHIRVAFLSTIVPDMYLKNLKKKNIRIHFISTKIGLSRIRVTLFYNSLLWHNRLILYFIATDISLPTYYWNIWNTRIRVVVDSLTNAFKHFWNNAVGYKCELRLMFLKKNQQSPIFMQPFYRDCTTGHFTWFLSR